MPATTAIFVLPTTTDGQQGPVAAWVSTAGWAAGARRVLDDAWILTPSGRVDPTEAARRGSRTELGTGSGPSWRRRLPVVAKTAVKDLRQWRRSRSFRLDEEGPWEGTDVAFVWQRHELFATAGLTLARRLGAPSVLFVPSTRVWEAKQWGVRRPGWSSLVERTGDGAPLRAADLVACGTEAVAEQARRLGVPDDRIVLTPTGVDTDVFAPSHRRDEIRDDLGIADRFVIGWAGSFRGFHALDRIVESAARVPGCALLLVGDGPERAHVESLARRAGVHTVCTGTVGHDVLADHLGAMDVALVVAEPGASFHYSPLKLAEYLASGVATVAPRVPALADRLTDGVDAVLVDPGDDDELVAQLCALRDDPARRARIAAAGRTTAEKDWSWDHQIRRILESLERPAG